MMPPLALLLSYENTHKNGLFDLDVAVVAPAAIKGLPKCPKWFIGAVPLNCGTTGAAPVIPECW